MVLIIIFVRIISLANSNSTNLYSNIFLGEAVKITSEKISKGRLISYENSFEKQFCFSSETSYCVRARHIVWRGNRKVSSEKSVERLKVCRDQAAPNSDPNSTAERELAQTH